MTHLLSSLSTWCASPLFALAIMLFADFLMTRLTRLLHLPNVTGYILAGILLGPYLLNIIPSEITMRMDFVTDIALCFIAFDVGRYFDMRSLRKGSGQVLVITLFESLIAMLLVTLTMLFVFHMPLAFALLLGAVSSATAPASTMMTIRQYKARGPFVEMIFKVVALDDAVALIAFSVSAALVQGIATGNGIQWSMIGPPLMGNLGVLALGAVMGWVLSRVITERRSVDHRLILVLAQILLLAGVCNALDVSPLLACMVMSAVYINLSKDESLLTQISTFAPPVLMLFFTLSGMRMDMGALASVGIVGVVYFFVRIAGKYLGAWLGGRITHAESNISRYLGLTLIPQAGVSIGLAALGQRILPAEYGALLSTIILSSAVLYEMVGPACSRMGLRLAGAIPDEAMQPKTISSTGLVAADSNVGKTCESSEGGKAQKRRGRDRWSRQYIRYMAFALALVCALLVGGVYYFHSEQKNKTLTAAAEEIQNHNYLKAQQILSSMPQSTLMLFAKANECFIETDSSTYQETLELLELADRADGEPLHESIHAMHTHVSELILLSNALKHGAHAAPEVQTNDLPSVGMGEMTLYRLAIGAPDAKLALEDGCVEYRWFTPFQDCWMLSAHVQEGAVVSVFIYQ